MRWQEANWQHKEVTEELVNTSNLAPGKEVNKKGAEDKNQRYTEEKVTKKLKTYNNIKGRWVYE